MAKIEWKTQEEIEREKNAPKPKPPQEEIAELKQLLADLSELLIENGVI